MMHKRILYIALFTVLGVMGSFLVHAVIEISVINLLLKEFNKYGLGFSWAHWELIHVIGSTVLLVVGIALGYQQGKHWWRVIYTDKMRLRG